MKLWKIVPLEKMGKYKVADRVYSPHLGEGFITDIDEKASPTYPIVVEWTKELQPYHGHRDVYTIEGLYAVSYHDPEFDITPLEAIKVSKRSVCRREEGAGTRMTVNEVLKSVRKGFVHFAILESTNSAESMYENVDTIKRYGKFVHPKFSCTLEELKDREVCDIFPDYCPEFCRYDEAINDLDIEDTIEPVLVIVVEKVE